VDFSFIIPVFNRPAEIDELLLSLALQTRKGFEVVVVEDGSTQSSEGVVNKYRDRLDLAYFFTPNSGPGLSRNYGCERAKGEYMIFLDSDCVLPSAYFQTVADALQAHYTDAFGGPDRAHAGFTPFQKAINFSMTSFLTTGGIRGGNEKLGKFHPRSFNMGFSKQVFEATGGFSSMRFGEDVDLSIRILEKGFQTQLIKEAYVFHKRRTNLRQFYKQVYNSGIARINLEQRHPGTLKLVHVFPALFALGVATLVLLSLIVSPWFIAPLLIHLGSLFFSAMLSTRSPGIGLLAVVTSYTQLLAYGFGFLQALWRRKILGRDEYSAFSRNFYH